MSPDSFDDVRLFFEHEGRVVRVLELVEKDRKETAKKLVEIENALTTLFNDKSNVLSKSGLDTYSSILYPLIDLRKSLELIQVLEEEPSKVKQK